MTANSDFLNDGDLLPYLECGTSASSVVQRPDATNSEAALDWWPPTPDGDPQTCSQGGTLAFQRLVSNESYMRRMYLEQRVARILFSEMESHFEQTLRQRSRVKKGPRLCRPITLVDEAGCKWTAVCTCFVSGGQLHCRLTDGWSAFCKGNRLHLFDRVVFQIAALEAENMTVFVRIFS